METVFIKNMVCDRCVNSVKKIFSKYDVFPQKVDLGEVTLTNKLESATLEKIKDDLEAEGFELLDSTTPIVISKIKSALINLFSAEEISENFKLSTFLTDQFPYDYAHLSRQFSQHEGDTIEHYLIKLRIEKAKEILTYKDKNVSEVAYKLGYTSVAHFSRQFKKITGVSPSDFMKHPTERKSLQDI